VTNRKNKWLGVGVALAALLAVGAPPGSAKVLGVNGPIAFEQYDLASPGDSFVFTALPDGSNPFQLVPSHSCCVHFSPDGGLIALAANTPDGRITTATVRPDGIGYAVEQPPDPTFNMGCGVWSPDGEQYACEVWDDVHPDRTPGIFTVRASDFGGLTRLTTNTYGGHDIPADYSPDGRQLAFFRENPALGHGRVALYVLTLSDGAVRRISGWQRDQGGASWSPDGRWILTDNATGGIYAVHPDGSGRHEIPVGAGSSAFAFEPSWAPDGKRIVFAMFTAQAPGSGRESLYTANPDGSDLTDTGLSGGSAADWGATISPR
jgi:hypothetical protein